MGVAEKKTGVEAGERPKKKTVFVISPIGAPNSPEREHADWVLNGAIKPVFEKADYEVIRADTMSDPSMISDGIFNHIFEAHVCVADLTFTNANVYYELGVRHAQSLPVIHIAETGTRLPFDNAPHNTIFFSRTNWVSFEDLKKHLAAQLTTINGEGFTVSNPITHALGRKQLATSPDSKDQIIAELLGRLENVESELRNGVLSFGDRLTLGLPIGEQMIASNQPQIRHSNNRNWLLAPDGSRRKNVYSGASTSSERMSSLAMAITQFMVDREGAPYDEILADFPREFGRLVSNLSDVERGQLYQIIMDPHGAGQMINDDLLQRLLQ
jgi:hypothetical protein